MRVIADTAPTDQRLVKELGADVVLPRGTDFPELVRQEIPDGPVDTAGIAALAVRDVGRRRPGPC
ncbi:hypothetical protein [Streptomyces hokutonensis]|uniref:hypothetical protein n=1 Tax=Streptomyces hokutonensis TaxID=1306990 RepID=UPI0033D11907